MSDNRGSSYEGAPPPAGANAPSGERRVALVIGNAAYRHGGKLANPLRDAQTIAETFSALGFHQVVTHSDLELRTLTRALTDFRLTADSADTAVVYFAGHGIEVDGLNRLIPVDAELDHVIRVPDETVSLNRVQQSVQGARGLRVVILDACRDNPFIERMRGLHRGRDAGAVRRLPLEQEPTRSIGQGLAAPKGITNMLVAYAADAGQKAKDGPADGNSPFASALVEALKAEPYLDVRFLFGRVRDEVYRLTGGYQEPAIYGQLGGGTYALCRAPAVTSKIETPVSSPPPSDLAFWQAEWQQMARCQDVAELEHFASHAPPYFAGKARGRVTHLQVAAREAEEERRHQAEAAYRARAEEETRQREASNWAWAEQENLVQAYERFLAAWPQGRFSVEAKKRIAALKAPPAVPKPSVRVSGNYFTSPTATVNQAPLRERSFEVRVGTGANDRTVQVAPGQSIKDADFAPEMVLVPPASFGWAQGTARVLTTNARATR